MKRTFSLLAFCFIASAVTAQSYESIKTLLALNQYKKAKDDLDKGMTNAKFTGKAEAYILKSTIYAGLASGLMNVNIGMPKDAVIKILGEPKNATKTTTASGSTEMLFYEVYTINFDEKGKVDWIQQSGSTSGVKGSNQMAIEMDKLIAEADAAFAKYKEMDPEMSLVKDPIYQNGPINIYSSFYTSGYNGYRTLVQDKEKSSQKWDIPYNKLKKAVEYSDLLIAQKLFQSPLDTNVLILAGIAAEGSSTKDEAVIYYSRLADNKVTGDGFESVYRFLVSYYFGKKNMPQFEKYKALGKELYPNSEYFNYDKVDFATGLAETFSDKLKALDEVLATDPANYKANELLWSIIYDSINLNKEREVQPTDVAQLETRMLAAMNKNIAAKPNELDNYLFMGNYFVGKKNAVGDARQSHAEDMKARTKPGTMASKEDIAKRDKLDKDYADAMEAIRVPYENAAKVFAAKSTLDTKEKSQYKNIAGYLAEIFELKKKLAKAKPTEMAQYAEQEKKWNDVYESIK